MKSREDTVGSEAKSNSAGLSPELEWMSTHANGLRDHAGEWVLITPSGLLAHGKDYGAVRAVAAAHGIKIPFIFRIPEETDAVFMGL